MRPCGAQEGGVHTAVPVDLTLSERLCVLSGAFSPGLAGRRQDAEDDAGEGEEAAGEAARSAQARRGDAKGRKGKPRLIF